MKQLAYCILLVSSIVVAQTDDQWTVTNDNAYNLTTGTSYSRQGNQTIGSDGTVITNIQTGVFQKGSVIYRRNGDFYQGSNGVSWHKIGPYWMSNDGRKCSGPLFSCKNL